MEMFHSFIKLQLFLPDEHQSAQTEMLHVWGRHVINKQRNHVAQSHDHCSLCNAQLLHQQLDFQPSACPQISLIPCSNQPFTGCEVGICSNQKLLEIKHMMHSGWVQHWQKSERNILIVICTINKHPELDNWSSKTSSRRWSARNPNSISICNRSLRCLCCLQIALNSC